MAPEEVERLLAELKELGLWKECCLGCGRFTNERDCGCPAGTGWRIDRRMILDASRDAKVDVKPMIQTQWGMVGLGEPRSDEAIWGRLERFSIPTWIRTTGWLRTGVASICMYTETVARDIFISCLSMRMGDQGSKDIARQVIEEGKTLDSEGASATALSLMLDEAHKHCRMHRAELTASEICGCFYCLQIYPPSEITEWTDLKNRRTGETFEEGQTAICKCGVDAVIGSASGLPITREFLQAMKYRWFYWYGATGAQGTTGPTGGQGATGPR